MSIFYPVGIEIYADDRLLFRVTLWEAFKMVFPSKIHNVGFTTANKSLVQVRMGRFKIT